MKGKLDFSAQVFIAGNLLTHLHAFESEIEGVRFSKDIEAVHRMRVASRRLRCTLPLFADFLPRQKSQHWLESITNISHYLGAVRDIDVKIAFLHDQVLNLPDERFKAGVNRLIFRMSQTNKKLKRKAIKALDEIEEQKILQKLTKVLSHWKKKEDQVYLFTPTLYSLSRKAVTSRLDDFLSLEGFIFQPENIKEIHEMRIFAKWLRYTCEIFTSLYSNELKKPLLALRQTQEILGNLHDCDVWIQFLPGFMEKEKKRSHAFSGNFRSYHNQVPGIAYVLEFKQKQRLLLYQSFIEKWQQWQADDVWGDLLRTVQLPFSQQADLPSSKDPATANPA